MDLWTTLYYEQTLIIYVDTAYYYIIAVNAGGLLITYVIYEQHYQETSEAQAAADALNGTEYNGNQLRVEVFFCGDVQ